MRLSAAAIMLSALGATPALAQETSDTPFEGATITAIAGVDIGSAVGRGQAGFVYGGQIGYDWQRGNTVFGIEAEIDGATSKKCQTYLVAPGASVRSCGRAGRDLYIGGRIGRVVGDSTLLYLKAGYANARDEFTYSDVGTGANSHAGGYTRDGVRVGIGIEKAIGTSMRIKAEYRYSNYAYGYSRHQGVIGIGFRF